MKDTAEEERQVAKWMEKLNQSITRVDSTGVFNARLSTLLRENPPTDEEKPDKSPDEPLVPLANEIRECVRALDRISKRFEETLSLLEVG